MEMRRLKQFQIQPEKALKTVSSEDKPTTIHASSKNVYASYQRR